MTCNFGAVPIDLVEINSFPHKLLKLSFYIGAYTIILADDEGAGPTCIIDHARAMLLA